MAFSLSSRKTRQLPLGGHTREEFLVLAIDAAQRAVWSIGQTSASGFSAYTGISFSSFSEEITVTIREDDTAFIKSECVGNQLYDWGKNNRNLREFEENFREIKDYFTPEELAQRYKLLQEEPAFSAAPETAQRENPAMTGFFSLFIPVGGYFITPILVNLNLLVFVVMVARGVDLFSPSGFSVLNWGANFQPRTLEGEPWRLLSCVFLHFGIFHLLMNLYALVYIGSVLEPLLGRSRFLLAFLATGLLASLASVWWYPCTVSAGASGAIFGLYGVFLALLTTNYIEQSARKAFLTSIGIFVGYNLLNSFKPGVDIAAHFGGLLAGLVLGYCFFPGLKFRHDRKLERLTIAVFAFAVLAIAGGAYTVLPNKMKLYEEKIREFAYNEAKTLDVFELPASGNRSQKRIAIATEGIAFWKRNLHLTEEIAALDLPEAWVYRNDLMRRYCEYHLKSFELMSRMVQEENPERYEKLYKRYKAHIRGIRLQLEQ